MDRSFAGRLGFGGVTRRPARRRRSASGTRTGSAKGIDRAIASLWKLPAALARLLGLAWAQVRTHRRVRIALIVALIATPLLGGGWLWLRNSSLVSVEHVHVLGAHGADASAIDAALTSAARRMSTLDVETSELHAAVAVYPVVGAIEVHASFPHSLSIRVIEQPAVASVSVAGVKTAVAADGVVLGAAHVSGSLPTLAGTTPLSTGERVHNPTMLAALAVLGAAPAQLAHEVTRAYSGTKGLTIALDGGLLVYFGDATRPHAKWASLARVLADASSAGAAYVDVRVPERPAAGFPPGVTPPASGASDAETEANATTPESSESSQALAEGLSSVAGASASPSSQTTSTSEHEEASTSGAQTSSGSEASTSESSETSGAEASH
jgi:cell division protein FtsQ